MNSTRPEARAPASSPIRPPVSSTGRAPGKSVTATSLVLEVNTLKQRLDRVEAENKRQAGDIERLKTEAREDREQALNELAALQQQVADLFQDVKKKNEESDESDNDRGKDTEIEASGSESDDESDSEVDQKSSKDVKKSKAALKDSNINLLIRTVFSEAMACGAKLTGDRLPDYPGPDETWPVKPGTTEKVIRFRWDQGPDHRDNIEGLAFIILEIRTNGAQYVPTAASLLNMILPAHLKARVADKFKRLANEAKRHKKVNPPPIRRVINVSSSSDPAEGETDHAIADTSEVEVVVPMATQKADTSGKLASRRKGKLEVRKCKRDSLPADHLLRHPKYDSAMIENAMSDDETAYQPNSEIDPSKFISRPLKYRSAELIAFLNDVDAIKDPNPANKYVRRERGPVINAPPIMTAANKPERAISRWMVDVQWLETGSNYEYDVPRRIRENGEHWGDVESTRAENTRKRVQEEKEEQKQKKRKSDDFEEGSSKKKTKTKGKGKVAKTKGKKEKGKGKQKEKENGQEIQGPHQMICTQTINVR
ncbi:hypothetical protein NLJ89_g5818 [Agrocybe chaxingu]|uniref:Uncharacterized protein n=1 Tax=Agrocybe chaxingu TaxID=84603 RepID=A0A9W8K0B9_9AGAR|nr:hypothetical protein NLJ89_g5818 [Agrocybe chaxingu]